MISLLPVYSIEIDIVFNSIPTVHVSWENYSILLSMAHSSIRPTTLSPRISRFGWNKITWAAFHVQFSVRPKKTKEQTTKKTCLQTGIGNLMQTLTASINCVGSCDESGLSNIHLHQSGATLTSKRNPGGFHRMLNWLSGVTSA